jgi:hypothetical protein
VLLGPLGKGMLPVSLQHVLLAGVLLHWPACMAPTLASQHNLSQCCMYTSRHGWLSSYTHDVPIYQDAGGTHTCRTASKLPLTCGAALTYAAAAAGKYTGPEDVRTLAALRRVQARLREVADMTNKSLTSRYLFMSDRYRGAGVCITQVGPDCAYGPRP